MAEVPTINQVKRRTILSALSLFLQSGYTTVLGFVANLVVTIILSPQIFGIYITVISLISVLNYFSDIGLAASLIQKKEIEEDDLKTAFTLQQILVLSVILIGFFSTNMIASFYQLPKEGVYLYWALLGGFFLSSLKTIPSVLLERKINFQKIVLTQVIENTVFYIVVISLALLGFSLTSFTYAVLARAVIGVILIYSLSFWMPQIGIAKKSFQHLLSFGLPFQSFSFLALFKDDLINLFLGKIVGFQGLGYIGWAKKWADSIVKIIMDNLSKVLFPLISRFQHDKEKIAKIVDRILNYQTLLLAPTMFGLVFMMGKLIHLIPKYNKWEGALPLFYLFCLSAFFSSYSTPFINLFNALGKVKISLLFMIFWTGITWLLTPFFTKAFFLYGFPLTQVFLSLTFVLVVKKAKTLVQFHFFLPIYKYLASAAIMGAILVFSQSLIPLSISAVIFYIAEGVLIYYGVLKYLFKIDLVKEVKWLLSHE